MKYKIGCVALVTLLMLLIVKESTSQNTVDEYTLEMGRIDQTIQQAQYLKRICDYFYEDKHKLDLLYSNSGILLFKDYIPIEYNSFLKAYNDETKIKAFIEKMSNQQKDITKTTCITKYPKMLQEIKDNLDEWLNLLKEDIKKAEERFEKLDSAKN